MKKIEVVAAVIINGNKVLCMQRNVNKLEYISCKYEFPGGKIELGESGSKALTREISEEMNASIVINEEDFFMSIDHDYPDFKLEMHAYLCRVNNFIFSLNEHINFVWCDRDNIKLLDWAAADVPIVKKLLSEGVI